jgi:hypothetical protein
MLMDISVINETIIGDNEYKVENDGSGKHYIIIAKYYIL